MKSLFVAQKGVIRVMLRLGPNCQCIQFLFLTITENIKLGRDDAISFLKYLICRKFPGIKIFPTTEIMIKRTIHALI
jgi:hypothetical protein